MLTPYYKFIYITKYLWWYPFVPLFYISFSPGLADRMTYMVAMTGSIASIIVTLILKLHVNSETVFDHDRFTTKEITTNINRTLVWDLFFIFLVQIYLIFTLLQ
jgi:hypothetical protein